MNTLTQLRNNLLTAECEYRTAQGSLEGSLDYILAREALNQARFKFDKECRRYVLLTVFNEVEEDICI